MLRRYFAVVAAEPVCFSMRVGVARRRHRYSGTITKNLGGDRIKHLWDKFCDKCSLKPQPLTIE